MAQPSSAILVPRWVNLQVHIPSNSLATYEASREPGQLRLQVSTFYPEYECYCFLDLAHLPLSNSQLQAKGRSLLLPAKSESRECGGTRLEFSVKKHQYSVKSYKM